MIQRENFYFDGGMIINGRWGLFLKGSVSVCVCALTAAHLWGHSYEYTPAKWGLFKLWGHFRVPAKKSS